MRVVAIRVGDRSAGSRGFALACALALAFGPGVVRPEPAAAAPVHTAAASSDLIISEFRVRGPNGANDEFVELYNPSDSPVTVAAFDASGGWAVAASNGVIRFTIPNGTVIPGRGHYLGVNSVGYSLASSPSGNGTTATGDATYTTDIPDNAGIALFRTSNTANFTLANRSDAVGSTSEANTLYKEGTGYSALTPFSIDYAFNRNEISGVPKDTDNNAADFLFEDTNGTSAGAGQRLGSPAPQNLSSPVTDNALLPVTLLDPATSDKLAPNFVRVMTSDPANNSTFGTVSLRRTVTNNTGAAVTRLKFRVLKQTTFPSPSGISDLRARTSTSVSVTVGSTVHTVQGTTLEQPPSQPNGSGYNAALSVGVVSLGTPLADGASLDFQLLFGVQQQGSVEADINAEALPAGGTAGSPVLFTCPTSEPSGTGMCNNQAPVGVADTYTTAEDTALTVTAPGVLGNDTDADSDPLTATVVAQPAHGTLTLNTNGSFTYTPTANYHGPDSFTYTANDAATSSETTTVSLTVTAVNDAPTAAADTYTTAEDTALPVVAPGVLGNDSDVDGDTLSAVLDTGPAHGTLTLNPDGSFSYTPAANYHGPDSFAYKASDGTATSASTIVELTVTAVNDVPAAVDDTYTTVEDTALPVVAPGVLGNDTDVDGDTLTATVVAQPAHGTLTLNPDGSFTYTPTANYHGPDSFTYHASDGTATSATTTVELTITADNDAPVAVDDTYTTVEDTALTVTAPGVLGNDSDVDGDTLTATVVAQPAHGTLTLNPDGSFTYTPAANYHGPDSFTYQANDGDASSATVIVELTVTADNDMPVAVADSYSTPQDTALTVPAPGVLDNDSDVDGDTLTAILGTGPAHGTLTLNPDGSFGYTPDAGYSGPDSFTYQANDGDASSTAVTVTLTVTGVNDVPSATDDSYSTDEDTVLTVPAPGVLDNDTDVDGDPLTARATTDPQHGTVTLDADGSLLYTPDADYNGDDSFSYRANDGTVDSAPATVTITIRPVTDPVTTRTGHITISTHHSGRIAVNIGDLVDNPDGTPFTLVDHTDGKHGRVTCTGLVCTYAADPGFSGADSFGYTLRTGRGTLVAGVVDVVVEPGAAPPLPARPAGPALPSTGATPWTAITIGGLLLAVGIALVVGTVAFRRRTSAQPGA
jgi:VCBS repeat-containing protein